MAVCVCVDAQDTTLQNDFMYIFESNGAKGNCAKDHRAMATAFIYGTQTTKHTLTITHRHYTPKKGTQSESQWPDENPTLNWIFPTSEREGFSKWKIKSKKQSSGIEQSILPDALQFVCANIEKSKTGGMWKKKVAGLVKLIKSEYILDIEYIVASHTF